MTDHIDVPLIATGDWIDAAWINQYIGDNVRAWRQAYTQKGAMAYALDSNTLAELTPPSALSVLMHPGGSGNVPGWSSFITTITGAIITSATNNILNNTGTYITFQTELVDQDNYFSVSNPTYFVIPATGWYVVSATAYYGGTGGGTRFAALHVNDGNTTIAQETIPANSSGTVTVINLSGIHYMSAGDLVKLNVLQNCGSTLGIYARMEIVKL